jgi:hypothetical protein
MFSKVRERINKEHWPALPSFLSPTTLWFWFSISAIFGTLGNSGRFLCSHVFNGFRAVGGALHLTISLLLSAGG